MIGQPDVAGWRRVQTVATGAGGWAWRFARLNPAGAIGAVVMMILAVMTVGAPLVASNDPNTFVATRYLGLFEFASDGGFLLLGSDHLGRDEFARILYGGRVSLLVGFSAPLIGVSIGTLMGIASAYFGGLFDLILQRFVDTLLVLPGLVIVITVAVAFGFTIKVVIFALALFSAIGSVRVIRAHVLSLRESLFIEAQRSIGSSSLRIIVLHLVPNTLPVSIVLVAVGIAGAIVAEAQLSFLGIGITPPTASWGNMLSGSQNRFDLGPHLAIIPGIMISITVLATNLLGDAVRDVIDPRLRGRR
ncbi:MAG: ABC transporter permease [Chloroflexi bacterium]|nr:ABC transporter permease [Chloroflexota bacterium]